MAASQLSFTSEKDTIIHNINNFQTVINTIATEIPGLQDITALLTDFNELISVNDILHKIKQTRVVLLRHDKKLEVDGITFRIAKSIIQQHEMSASDESASKPRTKAFRFIQRNDSGDIITVLRGHTDALVYFLYDLKPSDLNTQASPLQFLRKIADDKKVYIVILPRLNAESWVEESQGYAHEIKTADVYTVNYLKDYLIKELIKSGKQISVWLAGILQREDDKHESETDSKLYEHFINEIRPKLESPGYISRFVAKLINRDTTKLSQDGKGDPEIETNSQQDYNEIKNLLDICAEEAVNIVDKNIVITWYDKQVEDERVRMMALMAAMMEGIHAELYFDILDTLARGDWGRREPSLASVDYYLTHELSDYFDFKDEQDIESKVRPREFLPTTETLRYRLLGQLWPTHRRQLQAALDTFTTLLDQKSAMLGNRQMRGDFEYAYSLTLRDLTLQHLSDLTPRLHSMMCHSNASVRTVSALALAGWYDAGRTTEIVEKLESWRNLSLIETVIFTLIANESSANFQREAYQRQMRMTILEVVAFILKSTQRGKVPQELFELFYNLIIEIDQKIIERFIELLPPIVVRHFAQMQDQLKRLAEKQQLILPIVQSLVNAYVYSAEYKKPVLDLLNQWRQEYRSSPDERDSSLGARENILIVVALVYANLTEGAS
jgi:hypothetical protein